MNSLPRSVCPDCPATRNRDLVPLVAGEGDRCMFRCGHVAAREPVPPRWFGAYGLVLVRRGVIVRQRVDADGSATAIDAIGTGCAMPLSEAGDASHAAYAADDAVLCLYPKQPLRQAIQAGTPTAAQMVTLYAASLDRVERIAQARSSRTALGQVAALLCVLADTLSPPRRLACVPAALQQRDLASLLAIRHESVCRALQTFTRQGVVSRTEDGIRLLDRARLEAAQSR
jgi:CRP-like cAMP-binding protein